METALETRKPNALLTGGPQTAPNDPVRMCFVEESAESLKVDCGNRYEHYSRSRDTVQHEAGELRVYTWIRSTFVAE